MTLPYDIARCRPEMLAAECQFCLRWSELPGQTWGERTPQRSVESYGAIGCDPKIKEDEK